MGATSATARRRSPTDGRPGPDPGRLQRPALEDDWDRFEEIVENSRRRVPAMEEIRVTA